MLIDAERIPDSEKLNNPSSSQRVPYCPYGFMDYLGEAIGCLRLPSRLYYSAQTLSECRCSMIQCTRPSCLICRTILRSSRRRGDPLDLLDQVVDFEQLRQPPEETLDYGDRSTGGRPQYDPMVTFKVRTLAACHTASNERGEFLGCDQSS